MQVQYDFKDKTIFISGAANGIGAATAMVFAQAGANLILCDLDDKSGRELA